MADLAAGEGPRRPKAAWLAWAAAVGAAGLCLSAAASAGQAAAGSCARDPAGCYRLLGADPAAMLGRLDPDYEVGLGTDVFGPETGRSVPWSTVSAWAAAHPPVAPDRTRMSQGFQLAEIPVRSGYVYLETAPDSRIVKLYLSATPLSWD
jgi:hypothetical protein